MSVFNGSVQRSSGSFIFDRILFILPFSRRRASGESKHSDRMRFSRCCPFSCDDLSKALFALRQKGLLMFFWLPYIAKCP